MISRHRQQPFKSPFTPEEIQLDPEKGLWVPGRKTICIPAPKMPAIGFDWAIEPIRPIRMEDLDFSRLMYARLCDCSPGRGEYLGISRDLRIPVQDRQMTPITYNDITRSQRPAFSSRRLRNW